MAQTILCDNEGHAPAVVMIQWLQTGQVNAVCEDHLPVFVAAMADAVGIALAEPAAPEPAPAPKPRRGRSRKIDVADGPDGARGDAATGPTLAEGIAAEVPWPEDSITS